MLQNFGRAEVCQAGGGGGGRGWGTQARVYFYLGLKLSMFGLIGYVADTDVGCVFSSNEANLL